MHNKVCCYNYGSPRVGNKAWVEHFNSVVDECWRFAKSGDILIDIVPFDIFYRHVKGT